MLLHKLQDELARYGLGINSRKTSFWNLALEIIPTILRVMKHVRLQELSDAVTTYHEPTIRESTTFIYSGNQGTCDENGNHRFLRAYGTCLN